MDRLAEEGLINKALKCLFCGKMCARGAKHTCNNHFFKAFLVDDSRQRLACREQGRNDTKHPAEQKMRGNATFIIILTRGQRPAACNSISGRR